MVVGLEKQAALLGGLPDIGAVGETRATGKTTAGLDVQKVAYNVSDALFDFSPETFELDNALKLWAAQDAPNSFGVVPRLFPLDTRVGAALAVLGYVSESEPVSSITSVIASTATIRSMESLLAQHRTHWVERGVAFQVAAADYDVGSGELITDDATVARVARNLGVPLLASSLALPEDALYTAFLSSVVAKSVGSAIHVYDGVRGTRQAVTPTKRPAIPELPEGAGLLDAFEATNKALGTSLAPFEYYGAKEPSTVYVTMGLPEVLKLAKRDDRTGVVNVRLYSPFLADKFLAAVPDSAIRIVVVGKTNDLYKEVSAALRLHYGFTAGPEISSIVTGFSDSTADFPETGPTVTVWDSDSNATASAPGILSLPIAEANLYTKFDNLISGGAVSSDIRFDFQGQYWAINSADVSIVNDVGVLKAVDVSARVKEGGKLVIAAASDEELEKKVPAQVKLNIRAKGLEVFRVDYSKVDTSNTMGRTARMAAQAVIWLLTGANVDTATSRIVHANGRDTELVAATVNKIVTTLKEQGISTVNTADWAKVEIPEKEKDVQYAKRALATSFVPVDRPSLSRAEEEAAEPGANVDAVGALGIKKRILFREAFDERVELRPDVPTQNFVAKVKRNQRVTPEDYDRHIFQLELDITGTGLKYAIGEALGVHAPNNATAVLEFFGSYGIDPEEVISLPLNDSQAYNTAFQIFRDKLDLFGKVPKRFYEALANFASNDAQKKKLQHLGSAAGAEELKKRNEVDFENYVDVLSEFSSAKPTATELVDLIAPLKRREYSIASSQKVHPNEVHLLIVIVDWVNSRGEKRYGQCSKFLADLEHGAEVVVSVKPSVMKLPAKAETPVIMAGLGTGLAPFKAFLEEKMWQRDHGEKIGPVYLFLGSRHQRQEYLYGELFEAYKHAGVLTHIGAAFSRDQPEKIYIQHRIEQAKTQLVDAFVLRKGNFYLCGPTWPVPDISAALQDIVVTGAAQTGEEVNEATLIEDLKENERYILEVY